MLPGLSKPTSAGPMLLLFALLESCTPSLLSFLFFFFLLYRRPLMRGLCCTFGCSTVLVQLENALRHLLPRKSSLDCKGTRDLSWCCHVGLIEQGSRLQLCCAESTASAALGFCWQRKLGLLAQLWVRRLLNCNSCKYAAVWNFTPGQQNEVDGADYPIAFATVPKAA